MPVFRITIGIDPGQTGAIAVLHDGEFRRFIDMPTMARAAGGNQIDATNLAASLRGVLVGEPGATVMACLEQVNAMPSKPGPNGERRGMGSTSAFNFGEGYGVVQGVLATLGIPVLLVHPARWKKALALTGKDKDCARTAAIQRFPAAASQLARKKDVGRADALLIAQWSWKTEQHASLGNAA